MKIWNTTIAPGVPTVHIELETGSYTRTEVLAIIAKLAVTLDDAAHESKRLEHERDNWL